MQRVFTRSVGQYRRGEFPEKPHWWWDRYKEVSKPIEEVIKAGLDVLEKAPRPRRAS